MEPHRYYEEDHPVVSSGSVFRGYRDCYYNKTLQDSALPAVFQNQVMQSRRALDSLQEPNVSLLDTTLQRARRGQDASVDSVLSLHCMLLANHVNHDGPCLSCSHTWGHSRNGRRHRPEFIQLVTWNDS